MKADSWKALTKPDRGHGHKVLNAVYHKSEHEYVVSSSSLHNKHHYQRVFLHRAIFLGKKRFKIVLQKPQNSVIIHI